MKVLSSILLSLAVCAVLLAAGCTGTGTSPGTSPAATPAVSTTNLSALALMPADVPPNFTLAYQSAKNPAEISNIARDLGWQGGYTVRYTGPAGANGVPGEILQSIAVYPVASIPGVIAMADKQDRADTDLEYSNITMGTATFTASGFTGKAPAGLYIKPTNINPLVGGSENHDVSAELKSDVAEIIFSKGTIIEIIRVTGPDATMETVTSLAQKAYAKIP
ncbi:hypothetical protein [Methanoregula sp.]|uniref:hypothetical protein n=1 Tax=Methanoregula sp. TaxID=2052170 RepID=UPI00356A7846